MQSEPINNVNIISPPCAPNTKSGRRRWKARFHSRLGKVQIQGDDAQIPTEMHAAVVLGGDCCCKAAARAASSCVSCCFGGGGSSSSLGAVLRPPSLRASKCVRPCEHLVMLYVRRSAMCCCVAASISLWWSSYVHNE